MPVFRATLAGLLLAACSLSGLDGFSNGVVDGPDAVDATNGQPDATSDASPVDADGSPPLSTGDTGSPAPPDGGECAPTPNNLLAAQNADFEDGCALWTAPRADLSSTESARCGKLACRICPSYNDDLNGHASRTVFGVTPLPGEHYVFSAWIRRDDGASNIKATVAVGGDKVTLRDGNSPLITTWGKSAALYQVAPDDTSTQIVLRITPLKTGGDECIIVDDASLVRVQDAGL